MCRVVLLQLTIQLCTVLHTAPAVQSVQPVHSPYSVHNPFSVHYPNPYSYQPVHYYPPTPFNSYFGLYGNQARVGNPAATLLQTGNPAATLEHIGNPVARQNPQFSKVPFYTFKLPSSVRNVGASRKLPGIKAVAPAIEAAVPAIKAAVPAIKAVASASKSGEQTAVLQDKGLLKKNIGVSEFRSQMLNAVGLRPIAYLDPRALCSFCSCKDDLGCGYNCDKCQALCLSCDCETSLGCKYNCDKCESPSSSESGSTDQLTFQISQDFLNLETSNGTLESTAPLTGTGSYPEQESDNCSQLRNTQIELCMWGPSCQSIISKVFPTCNYSCQTCQLNPSNKCTASSGEGAGQPCSFPFVYKGVKYSGCAPLHSEESGLRFWCSTKTDVNGYHIRGPYSDPGRYVGFCDTSCPKDIPGLHF